MLKLLNTNESTMVVLKRKFLVLTLCLFTVTALFSQNTSQNKRLELIDMLDTSSIKVWTGISFDKKIYNKLYASMKFSFHTKTPFFTPRFSDVGLRYEILDGLRVSAFYRFSNKFQVNERRTYAELSYRRRILNSSVRIGTRLRWQSKFNADNEMTQNYLRPRVMVSFCSPNSRLRPYVSGELFYNQGTIRRQRLSTGLSLRLNEATSMKFFGRLEIFDPYTCHTSENYTFNLSYRFRF